MNILDKLERKYSFLSFPNLYLYMVAIFLIGLIMNLFNPYYYLLYLSLDVSMILKGQIWRLFTFIFYPPTSSVSIILSLLMIYVYYSITKTLTMMWRPFKFNLFMFIGYISQIIGAFFVYFVMKTNVIMYPTYTFFSIIMAFALTFPDAVFYIYFLIPIKAKYFAYIEVAIYALIFVSSGLPDRVAIICSVLNVYIFFVLLRNKI